MPLDRDTRNAIKEAVREIIKEEVASKLLKLEQQSTVIADVQKSISDIQKSIMDINATVSEHGDTIKLMDRSLSSMNEQIDDIKNNTVAAVDKKHGDLSTQICMNMLDIDTHRRKWSLTINGLTGMLNETENFTRSSVIDFAKNELKVPEPEKHKFAACHRLGSKSDSGIIVKFVDLADRNQWLTNAKNLKTSQKNISISPDLHPCLRQLKKEILQIRNKLSVTDKKGSQVKYCPRWPYVYLKLPDQQIKYPTITKEKVVADYIKSQ